MSDLDLVVALTWRKDYDLRTQLDDSKKILGRVGWENLDEKYVIAALRSAYVRALGTKDEVPWPWRMKEVKPTREDSGPRPPPLS